MQEGSEEEEEKGEGEESSSEEESEEEEEEGGEGGWPLSLSPPLAGPAGRAGCGSVDCAATCAACVCSLLGVALCVRRP